MLYAFLAKIKAERDKLETETANLMFFKLSYLSSKKMSSLRYKQLAPTAIYTRGFLGDIIMHLLLNSDL